jgi:hypothetical protein
LEVSLLSFVRYVAHVVGHELADHHFGRQQLAALEWLAAQPSVDAVPLLCSSARLLLHSTNQTRNRFERAKHL